MKKSMICLVALAATVACGQELLKNPDFNSGLDGDVVYQGTYNAELLQCSLFDDAGNKCLKFEVLKVSVTAGGTKQISGNIIIGRVNNDLPGVLVKPNTTYKFSFDAKGNVPYAIPGAALFHNEESWPSNVKYIKSSLSSIKPTGEWQKFEGTFKTGADTVRAGLAVHFWGDSSSQPEFPWKDGQYLLIDNVSITEVIPAAAAK